MYVGIYESRSRVGPFRVDHLLSLIIVSKAHDQPVLYRDGIPPDGPGIHIDYIAIGDDQIRGDPVHCRVDQMTESLLIHIFHLRAPFRIFRIIQLFSTIPIIV